MPKTSTRVSFGLYNLEIKADSALTCPDLQAFAKLADLKNDNASPRVYASYEPSFWLLDGQYKFLPPADFTTVHLGLMSLSMSDGDGAFASAPVLTVSFGQAHDTQSLSLTFSPYTGDYCNSLTVAYYDAADALIRQDTYAPTGVSFTTGQAVTGFEKIVITFASTNRPSRYLRVTALDYGELITFAGAAVKSAAMAEDVDQLSIELPYNTLDLGLYSADAEFSMFNDSGKYASLRQRQPLDVYETIAGAEYLFGRFYLDAWENASDTEYRVRGMDTLGILAETEYKGGIWTGAGIALPDLLESLFAAVHVPYELDNLLLETVVRGWLPICSYREALQQIGFAVGAAITCARSGAVQIFKSKIAATAAATATITRADKGLGEPVTLRKLVTGARVTAHNYQPCGESQVIVSGDYAAGLHEISFSEPMHALSVTGATIIESGVNYAIIAVATPGLVTLSGLKYTDTTAVATVTTPGLGASVRPNVLVIDKATLVSLENVAEVAQRVYDYHTQRYEQALKLYGLHVEPGQVAVIDTLQNKQLRAVLTSVKTDLTGGCITTAKAVGVEV